MTTEEPSVYVQTYSDKSFVVRGDTRPHRNSLKAFGGKWANRLTDKETGEKFGAWLFWTAKLPELNKWVQNGCKEVPMTKFKENQTSIGPWIIRMEKMMERQEKMMERQEKMMERLAFLLGTFSEDEDEEMPRLLK